MLFPLLLMLCLYYRKRNPFFPCLCKQRCLAFLFFKYKKSGIALLFYTSPGRPTQKLLLRQEMGLIRLGISVLFFSDKNKSHLQIPYLYCCQEDPRSRFPLFYPAGKSGYFYVHAKAYSHHRD